MIDFHQPVPEDIDWLKKAMSNANPQCCDYSAGNLIGWNFYYLEQIACVEECLVVRLVDGKLFSFPQGKNYEAALNTIIREFPDCNFCMLTENECKILEKLFPGEFTFSGLRNSYDYVYRRSDLAELKGKKYHSKRNHISYFEKNFNWSYEEIDSESLRECIKMNEKWIEQNLSKDPIGLKNEQRVLEILAENYDRLNLKGGLLRVDGEIVAFTFGERLNSNTFVTHYEKAYSTVRGAYPMINMLFARESLGEYEFINREDDLGSEGLRKAKMSYCPEFLVEKYTAVRN